MIKRWKDAMEIQMCKYKDTTAQVTLTMELYVVCSKSVWIGIVLVVHWVGCVCNQS